MKRRHADKSTRAKVAPCELLFPFRFVVPALVSLVIQAPEAQAQAARAGDFRSGFDFLSDPIGESFWLDMEPQAVVDRAFLSRFSQLTEPLRQDGKPFVLSATAAAGPPAPDSLVNFPEVTIPIAPQYATTAQFSEPYLTLREKLTDAMLVDSPTDRPARQLDYAQFLIAQMLLPEARGVIKVVLAQTHGLDATGRDRATGYLAIIARLGGGAPADLPDAWKNDPLWPVAIGGRPVGEDRLRSAVEALSGQSRAVATAVLPLLFDVARAAGHTAVAADMLAAAPGGTDLDGTGLLDLMRGRLAVMQGADDLAFDTFARVAEGEDRAAAEARVALADMALERDDPSLLPQVSELLQEGLARWHGDDAALRLRVRLARVAEDMGDIPTAVVVMSMILREHPGTPEAGLADARIGVMTELLAGNLVDPTVLLGEALSTVRRLDPALAGRSGWLLARMALARRLADEGLSEAARAEYAAIGQSSYEALLGADPSLLDAIAVEHARLLVDAGDRAEARAVLDRRSYPRAPEQMAPFAALRLQAGSTAVLPDLLLSALKVDSASEIADPAAQLALAEVALATGQPDAALAAFDRSIDHADQRQRLRAAQVAGEAGDAARAAGFAEGLTGDRAAVRQAVVENLAAPRLAGERLSISGASALITAAEAAGASVDALLSTGDGL